MVLGERPEEFLARRARQRETYGGELVLSGSIENYVKISRDREQQQRSPTLLGHQMQELDSTFRPLAEDTQKNMARYRSWMTGLSSDQGRFELDQRTILGRALQANPKTFLLDLEGAQEDTKFRVAQILQQNPELRADVIERAGFNPADNILKDYFEGATNVGGGLMTILQTLTEPVVDINTGIGLLDTILDVGLAPATVLTAGLAPGLAIPGKLIGSALRPAAAFGVETGIGVGATVAGETAGPGAGIGVGIGLGLLAQNPSGALRAGARGLRAGAEVATDIGGAAARASGVVPDPSVLNVAKRVGDTQFQRDMVLIGPEGFSVPAVQVGTRVRAWTIAGGSHLDETPREVRNRVLLEQIYEQEALRAKPFTGKSLADEAISEATGTQLRSRAEAMLEARMAGLSEEKIIKAGDDALALSGRGSKTADLAAERLAPLSLEPDVRDAYFGDIAKLEADGIITNFETTRMAEALRVGISAERALEPGEIRLLRILVGDELAEVMVKRNLGGAIDDIAISAGRARGTVVISEENVTHYTNRLLDLLEGPNRPRGSLGSAREGAREFIENIPEQGRLPGFPDNEGRMVVTDIMTPQRAEAGALRRSIDEFKNLGRQGQPTRRDIAMRKAREAGNTTVDMKSANDIDDWILSLRTSIETGLDDIIKSVEGTAQVQLRALEDAVARAATEARLAAKKILDEGDMAHALDRRADLQELEKSLILAAGSGRTPRTALLLVNAELETLENGIGAVAKKLAPPRSARRTRQQAITRARVRGDIVIDDTNIDAAQRQLDELREMHARHIDFDGVDGTTEVQLSHLQKSVDKYIKRNSRPYRAGRLALDVLLLPRALQASYDLSNNLRQGLMLSVGHTAEGLDSFVSSFRALLDEDYARAVDARLRTGPAAELRERAGLFLAKRDGELNELEENFMSRLAKRIPGIKQSERAYVTGLNQLRADVFDAQVGHWSRSGIRPTEQRIHDLARYVNAATGRGGLGAFEDMAPFLNAAFFSPRFFTSRIEVWQSILGPNVSPEVRKLAAKNMVKFVGVNLAALGLAKLSGLVDVELDPRSSDFGKFRIGDTRIDFWASNQPIARFIANMIMGEGKSASSGGVFDLDRDDAFLSFLRSKLSPGGSFLADASLGEDPIGDAAFDLNNPLMSGFERGAPLFFQDVFEAVQESGPLGAFVAIPSFLGGSVNTFSSGVSQADAILRATESVRYGDASEAQKHNLPEDLRNQIRAEARGDTSIYYERQDEISLQQRYSDDDFRDGTISPTVWRADRQGRQKELAGFREGLFGDDPDAEGLLAENGRLYDAATGTDGKLDFDEYDRLFATEFDVDEQAYIDTNTGLGGTDLEQEYRRDLAVLDDRGFWELRDTTWGAVLGLKIFEDRPELAQYDSFSDWRKAAIGELKAIYIQRGDQEGAATARANAKVASLSVHKEWNRAIGKIRTLWEAKPGNAPAADLARKWELLSTVPEEQAA